MAAQDIAVTCKNCGNKTRCSIVEWSAGFACSHCGILVQRPNPKQKAGGTDALATGKIQLDNMLRPTVSAVSLTPSDSGGGPRPSESGTLRIVQAPVAAKPVTAKPAAGGTPPPAAPVTPIAPMETGSFDLQTTAGLQRMQAENRSLRDNLKAITIAHAKSEAELDVLREQHDELSRKVNALQIEQSTLKRARAKLQDQVREMSEDSTTSDVKLKEDLAGVRAARDDAESKLARLQIEHKIIKEKLDQFIKDKVDLGRQVTKLDEQRVALQAEKETLKAESDAIRAEKQALEKTKTDLESEREKLQNEAVEMAKKVIPQDKLDEFKKRFASEVAQKKIMGSKLEQASEEVKRLSMEVAKKDAMVKAVVIAKATSDKKLEIANESQEEAQKAVVEVKILREKLDSLITELHTSEDELKATQETIKKIEASRDAAQKSLDDLRAELDSATAKADGLTNDRSAAEAALKAEVETLKKQIAEAEATPAVAGGVPDGRVAELEGEITALNQQLADLEDADSEELKSLKDKNRELAARVAAMEETPVKAEGGSTADQTLELKKALAKSIAEGRVIREKMTAMVADVKRSRTHIEVLNRKNAEIQEQLAASRGNDTEDSTHIGQLNARIATLEAELSAASEAAAKGEPPRPADPAEVKTLKATIAELQTKLASKPAAAPTAPSAEVNKELTTLREANAKLEAEVKHLQAAPAAAAAEGSADDLMRAQLESEILREKIDQLVSDLAQAQSDAEAAKAEAAATKSSGSKSSDKPTGKSGKSSKPSAPPVDDTKLRELEATNTKLTAEIATLKTTVEKLKSTPPPAAPAPSAPAPAAASAPATTAPAATDSATAELAAELARVQSELATAKELLADDSDSGKGKKKGATPDKLRILELTEQTKALTTDVERLRKKVKEDRMDALKGIVVPSIAADVEALAIQNREMEHKLRVLEQERHQLLAELDDWRDDGILNNSATSLTLPPVTPLFPDGAKSIIHSIVGDTPLVYALTTQHKVDTGLWARKSTCYLVLTADAVVVAAPGKQDVVQKIPRHLAQESFWNPVTNQLVFSPGIADAPIPGLTMTREDADAALAIMHAEKITVDAPAQAAAEPAAAGTAG